ncbi:hypothetical protein [Martelella sp.]|uniref:hypothetical protein n=1 Tax=Martelella sp. TaxID=1969699 RepID=UPI0025BF9751|nr:hypothetical protein [Martelella sp.]
MSMWLYEPTPFRPQTVAQGQSTLGEIFQSQFEAGKLTDNINSRSTALARAYDERISAIREATGETHVNPFTTRPGRYRPGRDRAEFEATEYARSAAGFNDWLKALEKRHPDSKDIIRAGEPVENDAKALARNMDEEAAKTFAAARGPMKWTALFGGRAGAMFNDPIQTGGLVFGGGAGAAKTVMGRILTTAATEALVNGAVQAATEPFVQRWRKEAGLESGWGEAARNVGFAALFGGVLGGAGRAGVEGLSALGRASEARAAARRALLDDPATPEPARRALSGESEAAAAVLEPMRKNLPAEARGALDAIETERVFAAQKPAAARANYHDTVSAKAIEAAQRQSPFMFEPDPAQVQRIADRLAPETAAPARAADRDMPIDEFLMRRGGVKDYKGELASLGLDRASRPFVGKLVKESGDTLDNARLAAAEAGYFDHLYGTADKAAEKSTISDLLNALDNASRATSAQPAEEAERRAVESLVHEIVGYAGPSVDDDLIVRAAELANAENLPALEALDRVLIADDARRFSDDDIAPFAFPDEDFAGGMDDPRLVDKADQVTASELGDLPEDMEIPFFDDDGPASIAAVTDELERIDRAARIVEACKL